jgi:dienelactone hydrolase
MIFSASHTAAQGVLFQTTVAPKPDEDFLGDCRYEITIPNPARPIRAVWVIFDRGRDMLRYYGDPEVQAFAYRRDLALLLPFHCRAKGYEDMDVDPSKGIGRALFTALEQLAKSSGHPELASAKLILSGFSGTGSLVARLAGYAPDRVIAAIPSNPSQFDPLGMDTVILSTKALEVPQLVLAGSVDPVSGTKRPYEYFRKYFDQGAPWAFIIQNKIPHCCIINAKNLILLWVEAMLEERQALDGTLRPTDSRKGWKAFIATQETETKDTWGEKTSELTKALIQRPGARPPQNMIPAGWLPNHRVAKEWLSFVRQREHPATSMP